MSTDSAQAPALESGGSEVRCRHCRDRLVPTAVTGLGQFWIHEVNRAVACDWGPTFKGSLYGNNADPVRVPTAALDAAASDPAGREAVSA